MKKKGYLLSALTVAAALTAAVQMSAANQNDTEVVPTPSAVEQNITDKGIITPSTVDKQFHDTATGDATVTRTFSINPNYGHLKLFIKNNSSSSVTVNLEHVSTGKQYFSITIKGNSSYTWKNFEQGYPQGMRTGDYILTWSGGSAKVNGEYWGKAASLTTDLP